MRCFNPAAPLACSLPWQDTEKEGKATDMLLNYETGARLEACTDPAAPPDLRMPAHRLLTHPVCDMLKPGQIALPPSQGASQPPTCLPPLTAPLTLTPAAAVKLFGAEKLELGAYGAAIDAFQGHEYLQLACISLLNIAQSALVFVGLALGEGHGGQGAVGAGGCGRGRRRGVWLCCLGRAAGGSASQEWPYMPCRWMLRSTKLATRLMSPSLPSLTLPLLLPRPGGVCARRGGG